MVNTLPKEYYGLKEKRHKETHLEIANVCARSAYLSDDKELLEMSKWFYTEAQKPFLKLDENGNRVYRDKKTEFETFIDEATNNF